MVHTKIIGNDMNLLSFCILTIEDDEELVIDSVIETAYVTSLDRRLCSLIGHRTDLVNVFDELKISGASTVFFAD